MDQIELLKRQTEDAHNWTNQLINSIPEKNWDDTPQVLDSNISWQVGHLIVSQHYHAILVIRGIEPDIIKRVPFKEYTPLFAFDGAPKDSAGKVAPAQLKAHLKIIQEKSIQIIASLQVQDLERELEPSRVPHPVAKNKLEALSWNVKHVMWHCGQMALLKRIVNERFDFGIKQPVEKAEMK